jgi:hypothetical protein
MIEQEKDPKEIKEEKIARAEYRAKLVRARIEEDEDMIVALGPYFKKHNRKTF